MMMEELGIFSTAQAIGFDQGGGTGSALVLSTNKIDLQQRRDLSTCEGVYVEFRVNTAFTVGGGTPVLQFGIAVADDAILATNLTVLSTSGGLVPTLGVGVELVATPVLVASQLTAGLSLYMPMPRMSLMASAKTGYSNGVRSALQRYLGVCWFQPAWSTSYFATGTMSARLVMNPPIADFGPDSI